MRESRDIKESPVLRERRGVRERRPGPEPPPGDQPVHDDRCPEADHEQQRADVWLMLSVARGEKERVSARTRLGAGTPRCSWAS